MEGRAKWSMSPGAFQVWECVRCRTRYLQTTDEVSSCPKCKCEERVALAPVNRIESPLSPDAYLDLWRFARIDEERFLAILHSANAGEITKCPACGHSSFIHVSECWVRRLIEVETMAVNEGLGVGDVYELVCDGCGGRVRSVTMHQGIVPRWSRCVSSMGCKGRMEARATGDVDGSTISHAWHRPSDGPFAGKRRQRILVRGELELRRLERAIRSQPRRRA